MSEARTLDHLSNDFPAKTISTASAMVKSIHYLEPRGKDRKVEWDRLIAGLVVGFVGGFGAIIGLFWWAHRRNVKKQRRGEHAALPVARGVVAEYGEAVAAEGKPPSYSWDDGVVEGLPHYRELFFMSCSRCDRGSSTDIRYS
jgi:hypothetical protein